MSTDDSGTRYSFGDSAPATERLALVAQVFEPTTRALLARLATRPCRRALDLGCGPGHTTRLLADAFGGASVVGLDKSEAFLAAARRTAAPRTAFVRADVTAAPLAEAPADAIYARFVLSHLGDRAAVLGGWVASLAPGGVLVVEEPEWITTPDEVLRGYLEITSGLIAARGGNLYAGTELSGAAAILGRVLEDGVVTVSPATGDVATMFGLNLRAWRDDPWVAARYTAAALDVLADALAARRAMADRGRIVWGMRQVVVARG